MSKISFPIGMRPGDAAVIAAVLLCAILPLFVRGDREQPRVLTVRTAEESYRYVLPQQATHTLTSDGYTLTFSIRGYEVCVAEADCPSKDCVRSGVIRTSGQSIVCIPARTVFALEGEEVSDADWILP